MKLTAATIIARNYLPAARVLARSLRAVHPDARMVVLLVDGDDSAGENEPFQVLHPGEIDIGADEFARMATIYDVMELCTAVKPWLIETLLDEGADSVAYLDPDIKVYSSLSEITHLAADHGIVLTPHVLCPMPRDGLRASESEILASGIYNLGFIAVAQQARDFLRFWKERLRRECIVDPEHMRFVDQRWVDFVPGMYSTYILRDPGYNVAYWNVDQRDLVHENGSYYTNSAPLRFFHFSGFSPDRPHLLSKHQGDHPRILLSEHLSVRRICEEYAEDLRSEGYDKYRGIPYRFDSTPGGVWLDGIMRRLYRSFLEASEAKGELPPQSPLLGGEDAFLSWLREPASNGGRPVPLNRYLVALHAARTDLQQVFPDPGGADLLRFSNWVNHEVKAGRLDRRIAELPSAGLVKDLQLTTARSASRIGRKLNSISAGQGRSGELLAGAAGLVTRMEQRLVPTDAYVTVREERQQLQLSEGIRVAGYLNTESGVGQLGRLALESARRAGIPVSHFIDTTTVSRQRHLLTDPPGPDRNVNLVCVNADELPDFAARVGTSFFTDHYTIGLWAWELEEFPLRFLPSFDYLDEVWALSEFARKAIAEISPKPVHAFPLPVVPPSPSNVLGRADLGVPPGYVFLFCFDLMSIMDRKNPLGLIEAFRRAFHPGEGPTLVIKVINGLLRVADLERLRLAAADRPDVIVFDRYLDPTENASLMASCDCYVSLHRSEGFGLTIAEAMALGKPVIATGYSANVEFMSPDTSYLVPWTPGRIPAGNDPYPPGARWAEPDLEAAAAFMREVFEHPEAAKEMGGRARQRVLAEHGLDARAEIMRERIAHAQEILRARPPEVPTTLPRSAPASAHASPLVELAKRGPDVDAPSNHPRAARAYRQIVERALQSHDDHQRSLDVHLASRVEQDQARLEKLAREAVDLRDAVADVRASQDELRASQEELLLQVKMLASAIESTGRSVDELADPTRQRAIGDTINAARELRAIPYMADPDLLITTDEDGRAVIGYAEGTRLGSGYASFEDVFRGPSSMIRERLEPYVALVAGHEPVVEIGSGRGEFLDLMQREGIATIGVEIDPSMIERSKAQGHDLMEEDGVDFLERQEPASVGAIFSAQVIEHIPGERLRQLLAGAHRALERDGLLILETVNPHSVPAFKAFWTDLTHRVPIFPEVLVVLCSEAGFRECRVLFPNGCGDLSTDRWTQGEYAVIARK